MYVIHYYYSIVLTVVFILPKSDKSQNLLFNLNNLTVDRYSRKIHNNFNVSYCEHAYSYIGKLIFLKLSQLCRNAHLYSN